MMEMIKRNKLTAALTAAVVVAVVFGMLCVPAAMAKPKGGSDDAGTNQKFTNEVKSFYATGGNITPVNFTEIDFVTGKWQGFYGNVSGELVLANDGGVNKFVEWTWLNNGTVFAAAQEMNFTEWRALEAKNAAAIDTAFGFVAGDSDSADHTFTETSDALVIAGQSVPGVANGQAVTLSSAATNWETNAYALTGGTITDYVFAGNISVDGTAFDGTPQDYQMIVPVTTTEESQIYYFYVELV
jgi:hypothetical protein